MATRTMSARPTTSVPFTTFRQISCPEDLANSRKVFSGRMPATGVLELPTDQNVRDYLVDAEGKQRKRWSDVHRAIKRTLLEYPENFCVLNGGIVIVARQYQIDEAKKILLLTEPSIINGAQTQGVIRDTFAEFESAGEEIPDVNVTFELIVADDDEIIAETSIARNYQNDVKLVSIVGRLGQLNELEAALRKNDPTLTLRKSETDLADDYVPTENLLQVITALVPEELWYRPTDGVSPNKVFTYSQKARVLKDFQAIYIGAHEATNDNHELYSKVYQFYLDIAADAYNLYLKWKSHQGFAGTGLRSIEREGRTIVEIPDGIVFPILASLSAFAVKTPKGWRIKPPKGFRDEELIRAAKAAYTEMAEHNPQTMGKSRPCYSSLYQITSIYRRLLDHTS
jgi:hypothetical protein